MTSAKLAKYWIDWLGTTWKSIYTSGAEEKTVSIDFDRDALIYGVPLEIVLKNDTLLSRDGKTTYQNTLTARLRIDPEAVETVTKSADDGAVTLSYDKTTAPLDAEFTAESFDVEDDLPSVLQRTYPYISKSRMETGESQSGGNYKYYIFSLKDDTQGNEVTLKGTVSVVFTLPEGWDIDSIDVWGVFAQGGMHERDFERLKSNRLVSVNAEQNTVSVKFKAGEKLADSGWLFVSKAKTQDIVATTADVGVYKVGISMMHASQNQLSMSNGVIDKHYGYVEVTEADDGSFTRMLYLRLISVVGLQMDCYALRVDGRGGSTEILDYYTQAEIYDTENGKLAIGDGGISRGMGYYYPQIVAIPIPETGLGNLGFNIPVMDFIGAGGSKSARVIFSSVAKVADDVNPLHVYDISVMEVKLAEAEKLLTKLSGTAFGNLESAIAAAKGFVEKHETTAKTSEEIKAARDALQVAMDGAADYQQTQKDLLKEDAAGMAALAEEDYETTSWAAFEASHAAANALIADGAIDADDARLTAARGSLSAARAALVETVKLDRARLLQEAGEAVSLANGAIASVTAARKEGDSGDATVTLTLQPFEPFAQRGDTETRGYIKTLTPSDSETTFTVAAEFDVTDDYATGAAGATTEKPKDAYPQTITFDVKIGAESIPVEVYVPVMETQMQGSQYITARLALNWGALLAGSVSLDTDDLDTAITSGVPAGDYTEVSKTALTASIAAGTALKTLEGAAQSMVNARVTAIKAASAALVRVPADKAALNNAIAEAGSLVKSPDYTETSIAALQAALTKAQTVAADENATAAEVAEALGALNSAISGRTAKPADKTALAAALGAAQALCEAGNGGGVYTANTWSAFALAYGAARAVLEDTAATSSAVGAALANLNAAKAGLKVDIASLETAIAEAAKYLEGGEYYAEGKYEAASLAALASAKAAADSAVAAGELTAGQSEALTALVSKAIGALVEQAALTERGSVEYSLADKTALWHYSQAQYSMGHYAIEHEKSVVVVDEYGDASLLLHFKPLTALNLTGYLERLSRVVNIGAGTGGLSYEKIPAHVLETYDESVTDGYGPINVKAYPKVLSIPIEIGEEEIIVE
ncbi:MAG: FIVAR domain-containing protein, partial [Oscillospiraceae bacterium]|nr:FIVAR domain-containing protein [Oscillospiraceae bacterium]